MDYFFQISYLVMVVCFWVVFYINQKQRSYIKKIEPLAENWISVLKERDKMIKNGTWDAMINESNSIGSEEKTEDKDNE